MKLRASCELCNGEASLYCVSDLAFLCWDCDAKVHEANFLVARHVRRTVCTECKGFDGNCISGVGFRPVRSICGSCLPETGGGEFDSSSLSSSFSFSDCTSSSESFVTAPRKKIRLDRRRKVKIQKIDCPSSVTELSGEFSNYPTISDRGALTKKTKRWREGGGERLTRQAPENIDVKADGILVNWSRKLGLKNSSCTVHLASHAFGMCLQKMTNLPFRVALASSLWLSVKICGGKLSSTWQILKRLEEISGVPAKLILLAESKLSGVLKMRRSRRNQEEGWAECS